jgi:hypothetical protein
MRVFVLFLAGLISFGAKAVTSDILLVSSGDTFTHAPGNIIFNGEHFVTPTVTSNGGINLTLLNSNAQVVSVSALAITGSSPRVAFQGGNYVLTWISTNTFPNTLAATHLSGGTVGAINVLGTNVADETVTLNAAGTNLLAVWQSAGSNSSVCARTMSFSGAPLGETFAVAASPLPQRYPSVDNDGTNHLVCWMQQNESSNDWRVLAHRITDGALNGAPIQVSETNSMLPYATACSFGTNFLVVWSANDPRVELPVWGCCFEGASFLRRPTIHGRMVSETGVPLRHELALARRGVFCTNVALTFTGDRYILSFFTWWRDIFGGDSSMAPMEYQDVHFLNADGSRRNYPARVNSYYWSEIPALSGLDVMELKPRCVTGGGKVCLLYQVRRTNYLQGLSATLSHDQAPEIRLPAMQRTNEVIVSQEWKGYTAIEFSTNLIHWERHSAFEQPIPVGRPLLFVRACSSKWHCMEAMRAIDWAKQTWTFDNLQRPSEIPPPNELFGANRYLTEPPICPDLGSYTVQAISQKPVCNIPSHTL